MWEHTYQALSDYGERLKEEYRRNLTASDRRASGDLIDGITVEVEASGREFTVFLNLAYYWKFMEMGVDGTERSVGSPFSFKKGWIPFQAIKDWVDVKISLPEPQATNLAYALRRSIPRKGIEGVPDLSNAQDKVFNEFLDAVADAVMDDISGDVGAVMEAFFPREPE